MAIVLMRIEKRGSKWVVLPESGDKVLGTHDTKAGAEAQLAAIEANKHKQGKMSSVFSVNAWRFAVSGPIRAGVWDRITSYGTKVKDGVETIFDEVTLSQIVDNFAKRKNDLAMCYDHQSAYVEHNGQPAPALAWYNALALVVDGKVKKFAAHDNTVTPPDSATLENGVYGYRSELTPLGEKLLPNYKYISPLFTNEGADEEGNSIGYDLMDVAVTNTPFQDSVGLSYHRLGAVAPVTTAMKRNTKMDEELRKFLGLGDDADDGVLKTAAMARLKKYAEDEAAMKKMDDDAAMMNDGDNDADDVKKMDDDAALMADDGDAASAMQKMARAIGLSGKTTPARMLAAMRAKMVSVNDVATLRQEIAAVKAEREAEKQAISEKTFSRLADKAIEMGYDHTKRDALIAFARTDLKSAEEFVESLPKVVALTRMTRQGSPITNTETRTEETHGVDPAELGAELAVSARKYAKDNKVSLRQAYIKLGKFDSSYAEGLARLRGASE